ncbi:RING finger protein 37 [Lycorma delicatula]|uniref:RING finger protein 37 n=1 Tax=Lycorma delicatula TaxID=130591 RepID=UPI003F515555
MLIDFCNEGLVSKISCSVGQCEGYAVNNLISKYEYERKKGFLVDYFIKPPVTLTVEFICEVQLSCIILWPRVGGQKTTGIEILTGNLDSLTAVGSALIKSNENGFFFYKNGTNTKQVIPENFLMRPFKSLKFLQTKILHIKITRTLESSIPALQKLEIWGDICRDCPQKTVDTIISIWSDITSKKLLQPHCDESTALVREYKTEISNNNSYCSVNSSAFQIPDEFIDPITYEVMNIPMIMPSGKIIDNLTLERCSKEEANWGRMPSDPFTGKLFTETSRPKMSVELKARIDRFIIDNSNEVSIKNLARSVGGGDGASGSGISRLILSHENEKLMQNNSSECGLQMINEVNFKNNHNYHRSKELKTVCRVDSKYPGKRKFQSDEAFNRNKFDQSDPTLSSEKQVCFSDNSNKSAVTLKKYDELKERSLDLMLKTTLSRLPSFLNKDSSGNCRIICFKCNLCNNLYELPCKHYICRTCLSNMIQSKVCKCTVCLVSFGTSDPKKIHLL